MQEISFTEQERYNIAKYLTSSYTDSISEKDEIYQKFKKVLDKEIENNNIEYNSDTSKMINSIINNAQTIIISEENVKKFLMYYRFDQSKAKDIIEEVASSNINFDIIDNYDAFQKNYSNQISLLSPLSRLFIIECFTNLDIMHNPIDSYASIINDNISDNLLNLGELLSKLTMSYIKYDESNVGNAEEIIVETNENINDNENDINGFGDFSFDDFETPAEWETILESEEPELKEKIDYNELLKNMMEFFLILPPMSKILKSLKQLNKDLSKEKSEIYYEAIKSTSPEYIEQLQSIMSHNKETNRYYYHGAPSIGIANQIMQEGLYMQYGDINRTAKPELNTVELLKYSYGHDNVGRHAVVIIDQPNNEYVVQYAVAGKKLAGTGQGLAGVNTFNANYVIPTKYIVGYIDKDNEKIIYNPNYYKFQANQISSQQVDVMIQAMIDGQLDTNNSTKSR